MEVDLKSYVEKKEHHLRLGIWRMLNALMFPLLPFRFRNGLLRLFGAKIGKSLIYRSVKIYAPWKLQIGDWSCIGPDVDLYCKDKIVIGDNAVISQQSYLCTASHQVHSRTMALAVAPIVVQDGVWVAARAIVLPGVELGSGAVVGAGAVVARSVMSNNVVVGNPARVVSFRGRVNRIP